MSNKINDRIAQLREELAKDNIKGFIVPSNDPHFSEYVANYYKSRGYISGFDGSAGTVAVTDQKSALWTDSRYFLQAQMQIEGSEIELMKMGYDTTPTIAQWLASSLEKGSKIGVDAKLYSISDFEALKAKLSDYEVVAVGDPFENIWSDRAAMPSNNLFTLNITTVGEGAVSKASRVREALSLSDEEIYIVTALDDVAWLCNVRGSDVEYNPVVIAYCAVEKERMVLFVDPKKVNNSDKEELKARKIDIYDYNKLDEYFKENTGKQFVINRTKTNTYILNQINKVRYEEGATIVSHLKSVKNRVEIEGFRRAMIEDGVALVKFNIWLEETLQKDGSTSEWEVSEKLREFRSESELFRGESFGSIVGYKDHGAIVHYKVTPESSKTITADGFLLIDSGGQYECGTTDITRTFHLSQPTRDEQIDFTTVLIGNINLATAIFPTGTRGALLDILARKSMYRNGVNYMHGTGHGIGHFLNVHEGPQSIRKEENSVTIKEGMVMSNEPAMYRTGKYGLRTENVIVVVPYMSTEFGDFLQFETITLFPIDLKCIVRDMLSPEKRIWINNYHQNVYDTLSKYLSTKEKLWLAVKTKKI